MEYKIFDNKIVLRLDRGEEIVSSIKSLCEKENIKLASVSGIGGTDCFTVGIFNLKKSRYDIKTFKGAYEITGIHGNVNQMDGKHYLHIHINCAKKCGRTFGGHLISCRISLTAEIVLEVISGTVERKKDDNLKINLFSF